MCVAAVKTSVALRNISTDATALFAKLPFQDNRTLVKAPAADKLEGFCGTVESLIVAPAGKRVPPPVCPITFALAFALNVAMPDSVRSRKVTALSSA